MAALLTPSRFTHSFSGGGGSSFGGMNGGSGIPSFNTSVSGHQPAPLSMADTLPSADFGFAELRERMAQFTARFDDFIEKGRKRVLEERNKFMSGVAAVEETQRARRQAIADLALKTNSHAAIVAREAAETQEMHTAIEKLSTAKSDRVARRDELKARIAVVEKQVKAKREVLAAKMMARDEMARRNEPELKFWETVLGVRVEGRRNAGQDIEEGEDDAEEGRDPRDTLRFVFTLGEAGDEAWFELMTGGPTYAVGRSVPVLERDSVDALVERLNDGSANGDAGALASFLKGMRSMLKQAL